MTRLLVYICNTCTYHLYCVSSSVEFRSQKLLSKFFNDFYAFFLLPKIVDHISVMKLYIGAILNDLIHTKHMYFRSWIWWKSQETLTINMYIFPVEDPCILKLQDLRLEARYYTTIMIYIEVKKKKFFGRVRNLN